MAERIAVFGGIYSNYLALQAALVDVQARGIHDIYCLGDLGAFGPHPDRVFPLLREHDVKCIQGNYDNSIGHELPDCQCGYTDPRDNHFARLSYAYTLAGTSRENRAWLRELPMERRLLLVPRDASLDGRARLLPSRKSPDLLGSAGASPSQAGRRVLMCHGSPRRMNEFLWESTTSSHFLRHLADAHDADIILATHTGIKWQREFDGKRFVNVGVLGRPENDGATNVWYAILSVADEVTVEFVPVVYDHERLARAMADERLPDEFIETIRTGWWTTCLEVLPAKERRRGRF